MTKTTYTQNEIEAALLFMAEESGESAYTVLGRLHEVGLLGFSSDPDKAARWYLEAKKHCAREAMWRLSELKGGGYGTLVEGMKASHQMFEDYWLPTDEERAKLLKESAELGFQPAIKFLKEHKQKERAKQEDQTFDFHQKDLKLEQEEKTLREALPRGGAGAVVNLAEHLLLWARRLAITNPGRDVQEEARGLLEPVLGHSVTANEMYAEHFAKNDRQALELYSQALALCSDDAFQKARIELAMADRYMNEEGDCLDVQQGVQILERLIDAGVWLPASANAKLAKVYDLGLQTARNPVKAYELYLASLDDGSGCGVEVPDPSIQFRLAIMTLHGNGCTADREAAKTWFRKIGYIRADRRSNLYKWARLALQLGWEDEGAWQECSMKLYALLVSANDSTQKEYEPRLSRPDVERLLSENNNCRIPYQMFLDDWDAQRGARRQKGSLKAAGEKWHGLLRDLEGVSGPDHIAEIYRMLDADRIALNDAAFSHLQGNIDQTALSSLLVARFLLDGHAAQTVPERALALLKQVDEYLRAMEEPEPSSAKYYSTTFRRRLKDDVNVLIRFGENLKAEREKQEVKAQAEREIREAVENLMAMFAHKFRGPVASILFNTAHQQDVRAYADAARTMNGLLDMFSVVSSTPERLTTHLKEDNTGAGSPAVVLLNSLMQTLQQLLASRNRSRMSPHYLAYAQRQGAAPANLRLSAWCGEISWQDVERSLQLQWEQEIGAMLSHCDLDGLADWMAAHLLPFQHEGFTESTIRFAEFGPKSSMLTVVFTELLVNAIKHATPSASAPLRLIWGESQEEVAITCMNPSTRDSRNREKSKGSGRGHKFLRMIADHLHGSLETEISKEPSLVRMRIPADVMKGGGV